MSNVSHHVTSLRKAGLVELAREVQGRQSYEHFYRLAPLALTGSGLEIIEVLAADLRPGDRVQVHEGLAFVPLITVSQPEEGGAVYISAGVGTVRLHPSAPIRVVARGRS